MTGTMKNRLDDYASLTAKRNHPFVGYVLSTSNSSWLRFGYAKT